MEDQAWSTSRLHTKGETSREEDQVFQESNRAQKVMEEQGFDMKRMDKEGLKQMFAIYFGTAITGEQMPDVDGVQHFELEQ